VGTIKPFKLQKNSKIGMYKVIKVLGKGWEGEVYQCIEGATGAKRALKLMPIDGEDEIGYVMHYAWFLEELSDIGITPRYYHMGFEFDYEIYRFGFAYIVQELVEINPKKLLVDASYDMVKNFLEKLKVVHERGYALGDWNGKNECIDKSGTIRKIDFNPGKENKPNKNIRDDIKWFDITFKHLGMKYQ
jgi:predicted Ser/Thr protein kinase